MKTAERVWEAVLHSDSPEQTRELGRALGRLAGPGDVVLLWGPVGAGKTVLASGILDGLGVPGPHPSPTFTLVHVYRGRLPAAHVDLYRLGEGLDPAEIDWEELMASGGVTVVEWPDRLGRLVPADALELRLRPEDGGRRLEAHPGGARARELWTRVREGVGL